MQSVCPFSAGRYRGPDGGLGARRPVPRPYAKWFSVLGAAVSTVCTIALAANFAGAGMPDTQVP
ncbi:MAG: hypothetical protein ACLRM9_01035 [Collinsella aerofaciens]